MASVQSGPDPLTEDRRRLRSYLLGSGDPPSLERFRAAVHRLVTSAPKPQYHRPPHTELEIESDPEVSLSLIIDREVEEERLSADQH